MPIDPARTDEFSCIASDTDVVIIFSRKLFTRGDQQFDTQIVESAAVSIPWALAMQLGQALGKIEDERRKRAQ